MADDAPKTMDAIAREQMGELLGWIILAFIASAALSGALGWYGERFGSEEDARGSGSRVLLLSRADVYDMPGEAPLGDQPQGARGTITGGPETANGNIWWDIDFAQTPDGWVEDDMLGSASMLASNTPLGLWVVLTEDSRLYELPGAGKLKGILQKGTRARLTGGPSMGAGIFWWQIQTEGGMFGWVREDTLAREGSEGRKRGDTMVAILRSIAYLFTALFSIIGLYSFFQGQRVFVAYTRRLNAKAREAAEEEQPENERWEVVLTHVESSRPNDWRLAIIEADIALDEALFARGFMAPSLADKLKALTRGDLASLDKAWEAHRIRNRIAHTGSDFILTQREARRVVALYEEVLRELGEV